MAVTIEDSPNTYSAARQKLMVVASSPDTGEPKFRYRFQVQLDQGSGYVDVGDPYYIRPNPDDLGVLNVSTIIKKEIKPDLYDHNSNLMFNMTDDEFWSQYTTGFGKVRVRVGERYANSATEAATDQGSWDDTTEFYIWNEAKRIEDGYKPTQVKGITGSASWEALMNQTSFQVTNNDHFLIPLFNQDDTALLLGDAVYTIFYDNGSTDSDTITNTAGNGFPTGTDVEDKLVYARCGPVDLAELPGVVINIPPTSATDWQKYTLSFFDSSVNSSVTYTFHNVSDRACQYTNYQLMFKNSLGFWSFQNAFMKHKKKVRVNKKEYIKHIGETNASSDYEFGKEDIERGVYGLIPEEEYTINTDYLTTSQSEKLEEHLWSDEVYVFIDGSYTPTPIVITQRVYERKKKPDDSLIQYSISFMLSQSLEIW